ncbi:GNAT family N-acetyltransferase [Phycicoccus avicenniae]|uniref:GNAT family N-acetyltransferase n=1 Tax=Phycicoccus avicenniae TaxID=2828860 RepID=UPI003D2C53BB
MDTYGPLLPQGWFDGQGPEERIALWQRVLAEPLPAGARRTAVFSGDEPVAWSMAGPARVHEGVDPVRDEELWGLYVARDHLGTGLGQELVEWAVADRPAELWVAEGNERAIAFYRRNGFALDGTSAVGTGFPLAELRMVR